MSEEARKYAKKLCEEFHDIAFTRDDARKSASLTVRYLQKQNTEMKKSLEWSIEMQNHCAARKSFLKSVNAYINEWDPYK